MRRWIMGMAAMAIAVTLAASQVERGPARAGGANMGESR